MDENTNRNVLEAALEARFNLDLQQKLSKSVGPEWHTEAGGGAADKTAPDKSIKRMYEVLSLVPDSHAKDNPNVVQIQRFQEDTGGAAYNWYTKDGARDFTKAPFITMTCGHGTSETSKDVTGELCSPKFFPDGVDPACQPREDSKDKEKTYFDWATLHEVGHAVDDKKGFMKANMAGDNYGGWVDYGSDVTKPAEAAFGKFGYDLQYIKDTLDGNSPGPVAKPADTSQEDWDKAQDDVDTWCKSVMEGELWWDGAGSKKAAINKVVYQRAYETPRWVSYKLEARKKGIHGYQFRAPGEWFAELYAAYYMDVLKPEHPAVKDWLPGKLG
jgi:hypothetical protein